MDQAMDQGTLNERARVLVVDDQPVNLFLAKSILESDYEVDTAVSGERALELAVGPTPPDLILLDVTMPGMHGHEVCRRLKAAPQTERIPVIFLTARHEVEDEIQGFELGCSDYIIKPFHETLVRARVDMHVRRYRQEKLLLAMLAELAPDVEQRFAERVRGLTGRMP